METVERESRRKWLPENPGWAHAEDAQRVQQTEDALVLAQVQVHVQAQVQVLVRVQAQVLAQATRQGWGLGPAVDRPRRLRLSQ